MSAARRRVTAFDIYFTFAERALCIIGGPVATLES
jgi:hypothetical protein